MHVAFEVVFLAQDLDRVYQLFLRFSGISGDRRTQENALDHPLAVKAHKGTGQLFRLEGCPRAVAADLIHAIGTVVGADIGKQDFEQ